MISVVNDTTNCSKRRIAYVEIEGLSEGEEEEEEVQRPEWWCHVAVTEKDLRFPEKGAVLSGQRKKEIHPPPPPPPEGESILFFILTAELKCGM